MPKLWLPQYIPQAQLHLCHYKLKYSKIMANLTFNTFELSDFENAFNKALKAIKHL
jgi:hypothetical protein